MFSKVKLSLRAAQPEDRQKLANLIHFEMFVHRHLDWRPALDWIGHQPYLIAEEKSRIVASLACPPDPPAVAWIRLFAVSADIRVEDAWDALWPEALERLSKFPASPYMAAIPMQRWFQMVLERAGFEQTHRVVMLSWEAFRGALTSNAPEVNIRPMNYDDLPEVEAVDVAAFPPVWQNSQNSLALAYGQAAVATVLEEEGRIIGYQISTPTPMGGHLARLAVHPDYQGRGLGLALVNDLLSQFQRRGAQSVTVNTQQDNRVSLSLYEKVGFHRTGEEYPVYQFLSSK
jgi:ribosomal protein S18 acetylase RimI-like enzyme